MEAKENYSGNITNEIIIIKFYKAGLGSHSLTMEDTALNRTELHIALTHCDVPVTPYKALSIPIKLYLRNFPSS